MVESSKATRVVEVEAVRFEERGLSEERRLVERLGGWEDEDYAEVDVGMKTSTTHTE